MRYIWQQADWPNFSFDLSGMAADLKQYQRRLGSLEGMAVGLDSCSEADAVLEIMVQEAISSAGIEGEFYSRADVASSIRNNLGLNNPQASVKNKNAAGISELMTAVRESWFELISEPMLLNWHRLLLANAPRNISVGAWRTHSESMQILSGAIGKEKVHFEAPPSAAVPAEMAAWVTWFNITAPDSTRPIEHAPLRAALAHLYFESIHPFEDGNGRLGRAVAEKALAQDAGRPLLFSLSKAIHQHRSDYYAALQQAQQGNEVTEWIEWFLQMLLLAQQGAAEQIAFTLRKTRYLDQHRPQINSRQEKALLRMLAEGPGGFAGGMTAKKYRAITRAAPATSTRDLAKLVEIGALESTGAGRGRSYNVAF